MCCCPHCSQLSTIMFSIVKPDLGSTVLFHVVDNCQQCGQKNIVQFVCRLRVLGCVLCFFLTVFYKTMDNSKYHIIIFIIYM